MGQKPTIRQNDKKHGFKTVFFKNKKTDLNGQARKFLSGVFEPTTENKNYSS